MWFIEVLLLSTSGQHRASRDAVVLRHCSSECCWVWSILEIKFNLCLDMCLMWGCISLQCCGFLPATNKQNTAAYVLVVHYLEDSSVGYSNHGAGWLTFRLSYFCLWCYLTQIILWRRLAFYLQRDWSSSPVPLCLPLLDPCTSSDSQVWEHQGLCAASQERHCWQGLA